MTFITLRLVLTFIFIVTISNLFGQNFAMGVKVGPSMSFGHFRDKDLREIYDNKINFGFTGGGFISFPLKNNYSYVAEFGYSQKGKKLKFNNNEWTNKTVFHFIDLSMALRKAYNFQLKPDVRSTIFFNVGPNIEYWLNGKGKISAGGDPTDYEIVFDQEPDANFRINYYNDINKWLFGIDFGVGMDAPITPTQRVLVELRFTFGQTNLGQYNSKSSMEVLGFQDDLRMNIKTLSLTAGYVFGFDLKEAKMGRSTKDKMIKKRKR